MNTEQSLDVPTTREDLIAFIKANFDENDRENPLPPQVAEAVGTVLQAIEHERQTEREAMLKRETSLKYTIYEPLLRRGDRRARRGEMPLLSEVNSNGPSHSVADAVKNLIDAYGDLFRCYTDLIASRPHPNYRWLCQDAYDLCTGQKLSKV